MSGLEAEGEESRLQENCEIVMDVAPLQSESTSDISNDFCMADEEHFTPMSAKTYSTHTNQSMLSAKTLSAKTESHNSQDSTTQYAEPDQTIILFDWDDTLNPTTYCRKRCGKPGHANFKAPEGDMLRALSEHAQEANALIEKARELARKVVIVTMGRENWVEASCGAYLPALQNTLSKIDVLSARSDWVKDQGTEETSPANMKARTFEEVGNKFYSRYPNQSWKNIISIGDNPDEREALERMARKAPTAKKCRVKAVKFLNHPSIKVLTRELQLLREHLTEIVEHDDNLEMHLRKIMLQDDLSIRSIEVISGEQEHSQQRKFGFATGEEVMWRKSDEKIPFRTEGIVIGFTLDRVCVQFPMGTWMFEPLDLVSMSHVLMVESLDVKEMVETARTIAYSNGTVPCIIEKGTFGMVLEKVCNDRFTILFSAYVRKDEDRPSVGDEVEVIPGTMRDGEDCYEAGDKGMVCDNACVDGRDIVDDHDSECFHVKWYRTGHTSSIIFDAWNKIRLVLPDAASTLSGTDPALRTIAMERLLEDPRIELLSNRWAYASRSLASISVINSYLRPGPGVKWKYITAPVKLTVALMDSRWVRRVDADFDMRFNRKDKKPICEEEQLGALKRCRISMY